MADDAHELQFGVFITPDAGQAGAVLELSQLAEHVGLDLVTFQDHPYQARFLDTWTLLSVVAAQTSRIRVAPNVANLPLRPPLVLAHSVATLDLLSGGRVELGLGAGAFWDAIAAAGGPRRTPGQGVDALAEAIAIIRAAWDPSGGAIRHEGTHYRVVGAHPGPAPAHDVEIWLGAYQPRMLALTGARADGWLPSLGYVELDALPAMNAAIDEAAVAAGRHPGAVRRMLNINGAFGPAAADAGFLQGPPAAWAQQLAELTLTTDITTYILAASSGDDVRRFAEEVAPAVRELVQAERGRPADPAAEIAAPDAAPAAPPTAPFAPTPTPDDGRRLSAEAPWDESTRPTGPAPDPSRTYTPDQQAAGRHLVDVHDQLRDELERLRDIIAQVARGETDATAARQHIARMTIRQNNWTLGTFCETYCRVVTQHHTLEDRSVFPHLRSSDAQLAPVIDRLEEEHETIADLLERVDQALVALVAPGGDGIAGVHRTVDLLTDALLSHFSYEERELIEPLARHGFS
jgi:alkanesulfonate monooxygenase SsuD/methylene tetrahydromethanopterin reductase-like flavin-dependent oxidoreductase (luciferase family)